MCQKKRQAEPFPKDLSGPAAAAAIHVAYRILRDPQTAEPEGQQEGPADSKDVGRLAASVLQSLAHYWETDVPDFPR